MFLLNDFNVSSQMKEKQMSEQIYNWQLMRTCHSLNQNNLRVMIKLIYWWLLHVRHVILFLLFHTVRLVAEQFGSLTIKDDDSNW